MRFLDRQTRRPRSTTTARRSSRRSSSRASTSSAKALGRSGVGAPRRQASGSCSLRVVPLLPLCRARNGRGEVRTIDQLVAHARELKSRFGFTSHKLKGGVFPPDLRARLLSRRRGGISPETGSGSIRTPSGRRRRRSGSGSRSRICATTTSRTRCSDCTACAGRARRCACRSRRIRLS